eukprot:TRINITY_DN3876_c0_g1_i1.p1 TRINITY_DN3876_c0_g1~~TRINITY_DN3876_c0_g1_i1.p1  ORF type:complete len:574 (-),score=198.32 TRINITY_DN3876_c0_g1_i1:102-1823(-)
MAAAYPLVGSLSPSSAPASNQISDLPSLRSAALKNIDLASPWKGRPVARAETSKWCRVTFVKDAYKRQRRGFGVFSPFENCTTAVFAVLGATSNGGTADGSELSLGLSVEETREENSRVRLAVTVPQAVCKTTWEATVLDIMKNTHIKKGGYKKGQIVEERTLMKELGERAVKGEILDSLLRLTLPEAMASVAERALKESEHITTSLDEMMQTLSPISDFRYEIIVDVLPEVKWSTPRAYASMRVEVAVDELQSSEEAATEELQALLKDLGSLRIAPERGIQMGDIAILDMAAVRVNEDGSNGERILSVESKGFQMDTEVAVRTLIPGFVDATLGLSRGEIRSFDLKFPEDYGVQGLRGVLGRFTVECKELFIRSLPDMEDPELPGRLMSGCSSIGEVLQKLVAKHEQLQESAKEQAITLALVDRLCEVCSVDLPNSLLEEEGRQMYGAKLIEMQAGGRLSPQELQKLSTPEMVESFLRLKKPEIIQRAKQALAVDALFREENLSYSEEELETEVAFAVNDFKRYNQKYDIERIREQAEEALMGHKVLLWLKENSEIVMTSPRKGAVEDPVPA